MFEKWNWLILEFILTSFGAPHLMYRIIFWQICEWVLGLRHMLPNVSMVSSVNRSASFGSSFLFQNTQKDKSSKIQRNKKYYDQLTLISQWLRCVLLNRQYPQGFWLLYDEHHSKRFPMRQKLLRTQIHRAINDLRISTAPKVNRFPCSTHSFWKEQCAINKIKIQWTLYILQFSGSLFHC